MVGLGDIVDVENPVLLAVCRLSAGCSGTARSAMVGAAAWIFSVFFRSWLGTAEALYLHSFGGHGL